MAKTAAINTQLLTPDEACERLRIGKTSLWQLYRSGELKAVKIGRSVRIPELEIQRFIERQIGTY